MRPRLVKSTKVAKLPKVHNSNYEALRSPDQMPEPQKQLEEVKYQNGQWSGQLADKAVRKLIGA